MRYFLAGLLISVAAGAATTSAPTATRDVIPAAANAYRPILVREARAAWGIDANVALFAAQIHQESRWKADAKSPVGARGLTQFMPGTAQDMNRIYANQLGQLEMYSPVWSIRSLVLYDKQIYDDFLAMGPPPIGMCDRYAMMLSGYNGGPGWVERDRKLAKAAGKNPDLWFDNTEQFSKRSPAAFRENRDYPRRIINVNLPLYLKAGWSGVQPCK